MAKTTYIEPQHSMYNSQKEAHLSGFFFCFLKPLIGCIDWGIMGIDKLKVIF